MCSRFFIRGQEYSSQGDLAKLIGADKVRELTGEASLDRDSCLCPVDLQGIVNLLKETAVSDAMDWYFGPEADAMPADRRCTQLKPI